MTRPVIHLATDRRRPRGHVLRRQVLVAGLLALTSACAAPPAPDRSGTATSAPDAGGVLVEQQRTRAAGAFADSIGVNVHWDYPDTPYGGDYEGVKRLLVDSGIAHVRGQEMRAADLHASGITTTVVVDRRTGDDDTPAARLEAMRPLIASGAVDAVEGPNEPDLFWVREDRRYRGKPFPEGPLLWQEDLYRAARDARAPKRLPVIGMSFGKTYWDGGHPYGPGRLEASADVGNIHPYPGPNTFNDPVPYAGIDRYYWNADFPSIAMDRYPVNLRTYRPPFGDLPMAATENGYSTWRLGQSEKMQGRYMPRLFLESFRLGLQRTYSYELVDEFDDPSGEDREAHFGLVRHDLTPKPAYTAVRSLLGAVGDDADRGAEATRQLDYRLRVTPPPGYDARYLHHVVLQRRDGSHLVALWHEVSGDDLSGRDAKPPRPIREVAQPAVQVSLSLPGAEGRLARATVRTLDDSGRLRDATVDRSAGSAGFAVPDRVTLVDLPAPGTTGGAPEPSTPATPAGPAPTPAPHDGASFVRVSGSDRVATALAVATSLAPASGAGAQAAVLAGGDDFADAMTGVPLARAVAGPLLLTGASGLDPRTGDGLRRLVAPGGTVYLLGGPRALGPQVERDLGALGLQVRRLSGVDRYETAAATAQEVGARSGGSCAPVLATGRAFADGASASGLLATPGRPLLFTDGARMPASTQEALARCLPGLRGRVTAVGGPAASAAQTFTRWNAPEVAVTPLVGADRYATSVAVWSSQAEEATSVVLVSGESFADALVGGTFGAPVLLAAPSGLPDVTRSILRRRAPGRVVVVGGPAALADAVGHDAALAAGGGPRPGNGQIPTR